MFGVHDRGPARARPASGRPAAEEAGEEAAAGRPRWPVCASPGRGRAPPPPGTDTRARLTAQAWAAGFGLALACWVLVRPLVDGERDGARGWQDHEMALEYGDHDDHALWHHDSEELQELSEKIGGRQDMAEQIQQELDAEFQDGYTAVVPTIPSPPPPPPAPPRELQPLVGAFSEAAAPVPEAPQVGVSARTAAPERPVAFPWDGIKQGEGEGRAVDYWKGRFDYQEAEGGGDTYAEQIKYQSMQELFQLMNGDRNHCLSKAKPGARSMAVLRNLESMNGKLDPLVKKLVAVLGQQRLKCPFFVSGCVVAKKAYQATSKRAFVFSKGDVRHLSTSYSNQVLGKKKKSGMKRCALVGGDRLPPSAVRAGEIDDHETVFRLAEVEKSKARVGDYISLKSSRRRNVAVTNLRPPALKGTDAGEQLGVKTDIVVIPERFSDGKAFHEIKEDEGSAPRAYMGLLFSSSMLRKMGEGKGMFPRPKLSMLGAQLVRQSALYRTTRTLIQNQMMKVNSRPPMINRGRLRMSPMFKTAMMLLHSRTCATIDVFGISPLEPGTRQMLETIREPRHFQSVVESHILHLLAKEGLLCVTSD